jgi:hypothetical protein
MPMDYAVNLTMNAKTVQTLLGQGNALVALSAVHGRDLAALPLVWSLTANYGETTLLRWKTAYAAYTSASPIVAGTVVHPANTRDAVPGRAVNVGSGGVLTDGGTGSPGAIEIVNGVGSSFTCGIQQSVNDVLAPVCAYPLNGLSTHTIVPLPYVVLVFTTTPLTVGEAFDAAVPGLALSPIVAIDLSSNATAGVQFDVDLGWSPSSGTSAETIAVGALVSKLIQPGSPPQFARAPATRRPAC